MTGPRELRTEQPIDGLQSEIWRLMREHALQQRRMRKECRDSVRAERSRLRELVAEMGVAQFQLKALAGGERGVSAVAARFDEILRAAGAELRSEPADVVAYVQVPDLAEPRVRETVQPAVFLDGELVRRGRVIVEIPMEIP